MANTQLNDYFNDSGWDTDYFYIIKSDLESFKNDLNSDDAREFMYSVVDHVYNRYNSFDPVDRPEKMSMRKTIQYNNDGTATKTYTLVFNTNIDDMSASYDVQRDPFKAVINTLTDNGNGTAYINMEFVSNGDPADWTDGYGWIASRTNSNPSYETSHESDSAMGFILGFNDDNINLGSIGYGRWYVRPWVYGYNDSTDTEGYVYGPTKTVTLVNLCFMKGTKISLADGSTKNVEDITYNDELLVWNFDDGELDSAKPAWISVKQNSNMYSKVVLEDGTELKSLSPSLGHRVYVVEDKSFESPMMTSTGKSVYKEDGTTTKLVSKEVVKGEGEFYGILTDAHMNLFANGVLTSYSVNNLYPMNNMKYVKDTRQPRPETDFRNVPSDLYSSLRLSEQPYSFDLDSRLMAILKHSKPKTTTTQAPSTTVAP